MTSPALWKASSAISPGARYLHPRLTGVAAIAARPLPAALQRVEERVIAPIANSTAEGEAARAGADARDHGYY